MIKDSKETLGTLKKSVLFLGMEEEHLYSLTKLAKISIFEDGETIFKEGEKAERLYVLIDGEIDIFIGLGEFHQIPMDKISEPGEILGWSSMIEPFHYTANAISSKKSTLLYFYARDLRDYIHNDPQFGISFMERLAALMARRLTSLRRHLVERLSQWI